MYQQITLIGYLGDRPEMRYTNAGIPFTSFSLAVNRRWSDSEGKAQERTTWFRVTAWRRHAEFANQYLSKGKRIMVIGDIEGARAYKDRDGNPRASIEVAAREIRFLDPRNNEQPIMEIVETVPTLENEPIPF